MRVAAHFSHRHPQNRIKSGGHWRRHHLTAKNQSKKGTATQETIKKQSQVVVSGGEW